MDVLKAVEVADGGAEALEIDVKRLGRDEVGAAGIGELEVGLEGAVADQADQGQQGEAAEETSHVEHARGEHHQASEPELAGDHVGDHREDEGDHHGQPHAGDDVRSRVRQRRVCSRASWSF